MFAIEHYGVAPDIMTMAKALGNGVPISAFIATAEIADVYTKPGASTLGGNPVSSTAGLAVLDYIESHELMKNAEERGRQLMDGLKELAARHDVIGDVRGLGLMVGAEFIRSDGSPYPELLDDVLETMKDRGFLIGKNGLSRNVMAFQPPLVITRQDVDGLLNTLEDVLKEKHA
jgi:4-aminobutyrate aminotransferase